MEEGGGDPRKDFLLRQVTILHEFFLFLSIDLCVYVLYVVLLTKSWTNDTFFSIATTPLRQPAKVSYTCTKIEKPTSYNFVPLNVVTLPGSV